MHFSPEVHLYHDGRIATTKTPPLSSHQPSAGGFNVDHNLSGCYQQCISEIRIDHVYYLFQFEREDNNSFIIVVLKE